MPEQIVQAEMNVLPNAEIASAYQWNAGGWWGSVCGAVAWMLVMAGFLIVNGESMVAAIPIACAVLLLAVAILLWSRRSEMRAFQGMMLFLSAAALIVPITYFATGYFASPAVLAQMRWSNSPVAYFVVLAIVPFTMLRFWLTEFGAKQAAIRKQIKPQA